MLHLRSLHVIHLHPLHVLHLRSPHMLITFMTRVPNCHYSIVIFRFVLQYLFTFKFDQFLNLLISNLLSPHPIISLTHLPSLNTSGTLWLFYFSPTMSRLTQDCDQLIKTQCFAAYTSTKLTVESNRIWHLPTPLRIVMHDAIKLAMAYLFIKLAMRKVLVTL